jgi:hypothetical protein
MSEEPGAATFRDLMPEYLGRNGVTEGTGFGGNPGLRFHGHIFAMLVRDELVVKLPPDAVTEHIAAAHGHAFDAGKGRPLRAWLAVRYRADARPSWSDLVVEAFRAAGGNQPAS